MLLFALFAVPSRRCNEQRRDASCRFFNFVSNFIPSLIYAKYSIFLRHWDDRRGFLPYGIPITFSASFSILERRRDEKSHDAWRRGERSHDVWRRFASILLSDLPRSCSPPVTFSAGFALLASCLVAFLLP